MTLMLTVTPVFHTGDIWVKVCRSWMSESSSISLSPLSRILTETEVDTHLMSLAERD